MSTGRPHIPAPVVQELLLECGHRCAVCGTPSSLDKAHIIPWAKTKDHSLENLLCLCANCHRLSHSDKWSVKILREYKRRPWVYRNYESRRANIANADIVTELDDLPSSALAAYLQRGYGWETLFFIELLGAEIESAKSLRMDLQYGLAKGVLRRIGDDPAEFLHWISGQLSVYRKNLSGIGKLLDEGLVQAFGPQEEEGDAVDICLVTKKLGAIYKWAIEWGVDMRSVAADQRFEHVLEMLTKTSWCIVEGVEDLHSQMKSEYKRWDALTPSQKRHTKGAVKISFNVRFIAEVQSELERIVSSFKVGARAQRP